MSTFALTGQDPVAIIDAVNHLLANMGTGGSGGDIDYGNALTANTTSGAITTGGTVVSYLYRYIRVRFADSADGSVGFSTSPTNKQYYGIRNSIYSTGGADPESNNPTAYQWTQATGGFGTTKFLWYATFGGGQVAWSVATAAPSASYLKADPTVGPVDLEFITATDTLPLVITSIYQRGNTVPATPTGGTYDFGNLILTAPSGWANSIPTGSANVYISQNQFQSSPTGNTIVAPSKAWTAPVLSSIPGPQGGTGSRGPVPMGYVVTPTNPIIANSAQLTSWFSSSRTATGNTIGLGLTPIDTDTACFTQYDNSQANSVYTYNGSTSTWGTVVGSVVNGNVFITGSVNANALNANDVYTLTLKGGPVTPGNNTGAGFWMTSVATGNASAGDAYMGGNVYIGNNLTVAGLVSTGALIANTVQTNTIISSGVTNSIGLYTATGNAFTPPATTGSTNYLAGGAVTIPIDTNYTQTVAVSGMFTTIVQMATVNKIAVGNSNPFLQRQGLAANGAVIGTTTTTLWNGFPDSYSVNPATSIANYFPDTVAGIIDTLPSRANNAAWTNVASVKYQFGTTFVPNTSLTSGNVQELRFESITLAASNFKR